MNSGSPTALRIRTQENKPIKMFFMSFWLLFVISSPRMQAAITKDSISEFNIGQLFAFYDTNGLCDPRAMAQFAVAKRVGSQDCQWEIAEDFTPQRISQRNDLPVIDINRNCYFSCVHDKKDLEQHTEIVINRKMRGDQGINRSDYDMYTFLAPCPNCDQGVDNGKSADLSEYNGVYWTANPGNKYNTLGFTRVKNDQLLSGSGSSGLAVIMEKTKVDLVEVRSKIEAGKTAKKGNDEIISSVSQKYLRNAVESYLSQHP